MAIQMSGTRAKPLFSDVARLFYDVLVPEAWSFTWKRSEGSKRENDKKRFAAVAVAFQTLGTERQDGPKFGIQKYWGKTEHIWKGFSNIRAP